jgi:pimeloyl-ACP methyl ester carboxylesterase
MTASQDLKVNWKNVPTRTITAGGVEFAYRELGANNPGTPVVFLVHLAAVLDNWDPRVVDGFAASRRVIAFDNRGIGASSGAPATSIEQMATDAITFIKATGFERVDLFGFSMGGMIAQEIVLMEPQLVRKMIIAGTGPAGGEGIIAEVAPMGERHRKSRARIAGESGLCAQNRSAAGSRRRFQLHQIPHVRHKSGEQRGQVVLSPDESQWQRQLEVGHFQYRHAVRTPPARGFNDKTHAHALSDERQYRCFVRRLLDDSRRFQATPETLVHQAVVKCRAFAPRKPDETRVRHVAQPEVFGLTERMRGRSSQCKTVHCDRQLIQLPIWPRRVEYERGIQSARSNGLELLQTRQRVQL